jgi:hypothetical protein
MRPAAPPPWGPRPLHAREASALRSSPLNRGIRHARQRLEPKDCAAAFPSPCSLAIQSPSPASVSSRGCGRVTPLESPEPLPGSTAASSRCADRPGTACRNLIGTCHASTELAFAPWRAQRGATNHWIVSSSGREPASLSEQTNCGGLDSPPARLLGFARSRTIGPLSPRVRSRGSVCKSWCGREPSSLQHRRTT